MTNMTASFDPQPLVDALEEHRLNINEGQWKQFNGDESGALDHAIKSINLLTHTLFSILGEENRRELRQITADTHNAATYFDLPDDVEFCDEFDRTQAAAN